MSSCPIFDFTVIPVSLDSTIEGLVAIDKYIDISNVYILFINNRGYILLMNLFCIIKYYLILIYLIQKKKLIN